MVTWKHYRPGPWQATKQPMSIYIVQEHYDYSGFTIVFLTPDLNKALEVAKSVNGDWVEVVQMELDHLYDGIDDGKSVYHQKCTRP